MTHPGRRRPGARGALLVPALVLTLLSTALSSAPLAAATAPAATAAAAGAPAVTGERYLDQVFSEVKVTKDIKYSRQYNIDHWEDLYLDLYEPVGDTSRQRPTVIWAHGGWFAFGSKNGGTSVDMGMELAKRGFVVASINYRLDPGNGWNSFSSVYEALSDDRFFNSLLRGTHDVGFASKFLRENAETYNLHPEAIFASGHSAGAVASLTNAYLPVHSETTAVRVAAVASFAGMTFAWYAEEGEPPTIMFHGTSDGTVPYSGAQDFCDTASARITCELVSFPGGGHGITGDWEHLRELMSHFFFDEVLDGLGFTTELNPLGGASTFHPVTPFRLVDTRDGTGAPAAPLGPGGSLVTDPTGVGGVPATDVTGVVANVTVTDGSAASHLTVWPGDETMPTASSLNWDAGVTRANLVTVKVGADGSLALANNDGDVDVIVDVLGWLGPDPAGDRLHTVTPFRLVDTRDGTGAPLGTLGPGEVLTIDPTDTGGVPDTGVAGVVANVTVTGGTAPSHLTAWPTGETMPTASALNWIAGQTVPNQLIAKLGADGMLQLRNNSGQVHVIVDVVGWLGPEQLDGRGCTLLSPTRVLDTRDGTGAPVGPLGPGDDRTLALTGTAGIPVAGVGAVFGNATVTDGTAASHLTIWPTGGAMPGVSNLNWAAGETVPNHVVAVLGDGGATDLANHAGSAHVITDATAWC